MYTTRPYERNGLYNTPMNPAHQHAQKRQTSPMTKSQLPLLLVVLGLSSHQVSATPIQGTVLEMRDSTSNAQSLTPKIWVPAVVAVIVLFGIAIMTWTKKSFPRSLRLFNFTGAASVSPLGGATRDRRELTAEQLAGTINGENQTAAAPRTTRRARRPRRTPSQMSVTSLPAYNKEPGEEELVIFRGRDMEDATMPAAVVARTSADEDDDSMSHDHSQVSRYSPMPTSPHNMPLLHNNDTFDGDLSVQSLQASGEELPRRSFDTGSQEASSLTRVDSNHSANSNNQPDPRGEAPAYFEVVDQSTVDLNQQPNTSPSTSPEPASPNANRRSGFRTLLNRMSIVAHPHGHNRNESSQSAFSSNMAHSLEPTMSRTSHRTTPSGSGSVLSSSMFRTISRQKSTHTLNSARLNSPSVISLNSISAPLTHTATRTEFTYPKSGPTAEQLKVISSRETFTRFGVPYGADAIAFASSSRLDLLPPPDFETVASERSSSPGPSRLRSVSNVALTAPPPKTTETSETASTTTANDQSSPRLSSSPPPTTVEDEDNKSSSEATTTSHPEASPSMSKNHNPISGPDFTASEQQQQKQSTTTSSNSSTTSPSSAKQTVNEFGKLSAPPSSYSKQTGPSSRSESRASIYSNQTFATAAESMSPSMHANMRTDTTDAEFFDANDDLSSGPSTPRLGAQHPL